MRISTISFEKFSREKTLRADFEYQSDLGQLDNDFYMLRELFDFPESQKINENDLYEDFLYCEIGDVDKNGDIYPIKLNFSERNLADENYYKKIEKGDIMPVSTGDILISKVRPNLKKYVFIDDDNCDVFFTTAFIKLKPKIMSKVLYYCLRTVFYKKLMAASRQGKGYPTLSLMDLEQIRFKKHTIDSLLAKEKLISNKIGSIDQKIKELQKSVVSDQIIIDSVFQQEFNLDYATFHKLKENRKYTLKQSDFSNNPDLRFSAKFHRPAGDFVMSELTQRSDKKIKNYLAEPIVLGASISPSNFDENGDAYYISMASIKTLEVELDESQLVSSSYYDSNIAKSLCKDDILIARSGVAIGKAAIVESEFKGIFADFTMRIRFNDAIYNPKFAYFYIRTMYFQYLIEIYKKGLQNQNIFPVVIREFPILDISITEQNRIVNVIQKEMSKQNNTREQISNLRNQIDEIIIDTIKK